jgi:AcrR family transcriptional regulator
MQREEKSERSRRLLLDVALELFSHRGYGATSVREIADAARVSTGSVYHHFPDKESIFRTLLDDYWLITESKRFPFNRALTTTRFPDNIEQLGFAARDSVREYRQYMALIYVDVIEFDGTHIRKFYSEMSQRFGKFFEDRGEAEAIQAQLRPGVSPVSALLLTTRLFFNYFMLEILFNVPQPFGKESSQMVVEIADIVRNGISDRSR